MECSFLSLKGCTNHTIYIFRLPEERKPSYKLTHLRLHTCAWQDVNCFHCSAVKPLISKQSYSCDILLFTYIPSGHIVLSKKATATSCLFGVLHTFARSGTNMVVWAPSIYGGNSYFSLSCVCEIIADLCPYTEHKICSST